MGGGKHARVGDRNWRGDTSRAIILIFILIERGAGVERGNRGLKGRRNLPLHNLHGVASCRTLTRHGMFQLVALGRCFPRCFASSPSAAVSTHPFHSLTLLPSFTRNYPKELL